MPDMKTLANTANKDGNSHGNQQPFEHQKTQELQILNKCCEELRRMSQPMCENVYWLTDMYHLLTICIKCQTAIFIIQHGTEPKPKILSTLPLSKLTKQKREKKNGGCRAKWRKEDNVLCEALKQSKAIIIIRLKDFFPL